MAKTHIVCSPEPIKRGTADVAALCGAIIRHFDYRFHVEGDLQQIDVANQLGNCRKCRAAEKKGRYLYGACEGPLLREEDTDD